MLEPDAIRRRSRGGKCQQRAPVATDMIGDEHGVEAECLGAGRRRSDRAEVVGAQLQTEAERTHWWALSDGSGHLPRAA